MVGTAVGTFCKAKKIYDGAFYLDSDDGEKGTLVPLS